MTAKIDVAAASARLLMDTLGLKNPPIAMKFTASAEDIPPEAVRPYRDLKHKYAICQVISFARENGNTYAMGLEDHWCWFPLIALGYVKVEKGNPDYEICLRNLGIPERDREERFFEKFPTLEYGSMKYLLVAPATNLTFEPDLLLVYTDNNQQMRDMIGAIKYMTGDVLNVSLDYVDSCGWALVPALKTGEFRMTIPDPGEIERAEIGDNELILTAPADRFERLAEVTALKRKHKLGRPGCNCGRIPYFPRAEFINRLYGLWGLETDDNNISWHETERGY